MKWKGKIDFECRPQYDGDDLITTDEVTTISGALSDEIDSDITTHAGSADHDGRYYTQSEVDTISGTLSDEIDSDISTHASNADTHHNRSHDMTGTSDHTANNWKVFYSDGSGDVQELALTTSGTVLQSNGPATAPSFEEASAASSSVFGSEYAYAESLTESSHGNSAYEQKVRLTATSIPAGTYRLGWSYNWSQSSTSYDFQARVQQDDTTDLMNHSQEPQDSGTDQLHETGGFIHISLGAGSYDFDLDYRPEGGDGTAYIRDAKLEFWRVS